VGREPSGEQTRTVLELMRVWLSRRGLSPEELDEVCSDAVLRLIDAARAGGLDPARPPGAWLRVVADHLAIDALRRRPRSATVAFDERRHSLAGQDERITALLEREAAREEYRAAMRSAARAGQHELVHVISTWMWLADVNGVEPSSRDVAARLGVSHTHVQRALRSFREHFPAR
jgi:RNA polymerase sigma factor (sigma-70 family)